VPIVLRLLRISPLLLLAGCGQPEPPQAPPPAVEYEAVTAEAVATEFEFVARTRASEDTQVRARVTGQVIERNFEEGQAVDKGALLFRIDPRPYQAALDSARADLSQAETALSVAERNLARAKELEPQGYISEAEIDKLQGERDRAAAAVGAAQAAVENARINVDFTEIRAPFAGTAGRSELSIGDLVDASAGPLVTLVQRDPMLVDFDVDEQALAESMSINQERQSRGLPPVEYSVRLKLVNGNMYARPGIIDYANNRINPQTGTITVTASFPNPDNLLIPGQFARVLVQRGEAQQRLLVPQPSILEDMQGSYVFVVDDGVVERRNVKAGQLAGVNRVIESGLAEGDHVIVNGIQKVRPGHEVTATPVTSSVDDAQ